MKQIASVYEIGAHMEFYSEDEISKIIKRSAKILGVDISSDAVGEVAKRSRFTPRTANYFLKRARDYAQVHKKNMDRGAVLESLSLLGVDDIGLFPSDRTILEIIIDKFGGGPVGLGTIAAAISEEESNIEEVIEPYLIQKGLLERTSRGRAATKKAYEHLNRKHSGKQDKLI